MKKEKLIIKNFGPIKSIDLDLGRITILIGEQASGKSTVAKVLSICRYFSYLIDDSELMFDYKSSFTRTALVDWGLDGFENLNSYIQYINDDYKVEIQHQERFNLDDERINIPRSQVFKPTLTPISERFKELIANYNRLKPKPKLSFGIENEWHIPHSFLTTDVKNIMNNPFYFPTERGLQSIFSIGKRGIENLNDRLYEQLAALNGIAKNFGKETTIEPLNIQFKYENGQARIKAVNYTEYVNMAQGASGYKSTIPIVLSIKYYNEVEKRKRTFIIEEPEQNLFPKAQKSLIEFLVDSVNQYGHSLVITTHSPYNLTALENLMYAFKLGNALNGKYQSAVGNIIDKKYWIDPKNVNVYALEKESQRDLMIRTEALIDKEYIDGVSEIINKDFDELLKIEMKIEKHS